MCDFLTKMSQCSKMFQYPPSPNCILLQYECKKHHICEKDYICNPATCSCKNGKYLASIIYNLVITCNEIIDAEEEKSYSNKL